MLLIECGASFFFACVTIGPCLGCDVSVSQGTWIEEELIHFFLPPSIELRSRTPTASSSKLSSSLCAAGETSSGKSVIGAARDQAWEPASGGAGEVASHLTAEQPFYDPVVATRRSPPSGHRAFSR